MKKFKRQSDEIKAFPLTGVDSEITFGIRWIPEEAVKDETTGKYFASGRNPKPVRDVPIKRYEAIQALAPTVDLKVIMAKAKFDPSVLQVRQGSYADISDIPDDPHLISEYGVNAIEKAKSAFKSLPDNIQEAFGSEDEFIKSILDNSVDNVVSGLLSKLNTNEEVLDNV